MLVLPCSWWTVIAEWMDGRMAGWLAGWGLQCVRMYGYRLCGPWTARHGGLKASTAQEDEETRGKKTG